MCIRDRFIDSISLLSGLLKKVADEFLKSNFWHGHTLLSGTIFRGFQTPNMDPGIVCCVSLLMPLDSVNSHSVVLCVGLNCLSAL